MIHRSIIDLQRETNLEHADLQWFHNAFTHVYQTLWTEPNVDMMNSIIN